MTAPRDETPHPDDSQDSSKPEEPVHESSPSDADSSQEEEPASSSEESEASESPETREVSEDLEGAGESEESDLPEWEPLTPELVEDEAIRGDFVLRWAVVLLAFLLGSTQIAETATLVHVKSGQYLASHGWWPPSEDVFSYTAAERSWVNLSWLFDLVLAGVMGIAGAAGLTVLKAVLAAVTFWLIVHISKEDVSTWWGSICAALALLACSFQFDAEPEIVTLLGVALTLWFLQNWKQKPAVASLWGLIPVFVVWSNLDARMFLGPFLLLLYGMGEGLGAWFQHSGIESASDRKKLWTVIGAGFAAALLNPFGWHALSAPLELYGEQYPALREAFGVTPSAAQLQYFPMVDAIFWERLTHHGMATLVLMVASAVTLVLNRKKLDWGEAGVFLGFAGLSLFAGHERAAGSLVFCVLATLNAQTWYRTNFRQTYSVETSELLFSRGGRALTVLAFFALAFLTATGRLDGPKGGRAGFGFDPGLQDRIESLRREMTDSYDDRPFHFRIEQGDLLIWLGQKSFIDSRLCLYQGGGDKDLIKLHDKTRRALRSSRSEDPESGKPEVWKATFDRFRVTHVMPRLWGASPDYLTFLDLLRSEDWRLTQLGASAAVFYRTDTDEAELTSYLDNHSVSFLRKAFREKTGGASERPNWAQPRSFYEKYLSGSSSHVPSNIQLARHYMQMMGLQGLVPQMRLAFAYLAIRKANEGLAEDPQSADAYRLLGTTYEFLGNLESELARSGGGQHENWMRFYQSVQAYQQALVREPETPVIHMRLFEIFARRQKWDLALRSLNRYEELAAEKETLSEEELAQQSRNVQSRERLQEMVKNVAQGVEKALEEDRDRFQIAQGAYQSGCVLEALEVLEEDPPYLAQNAAAQRLQAILLMESGRVQEAYEVLVSLENVAEQAQAPLQNWRSPAALSSLSVAEYDRAARLWGTEADQRFSQGMQRVLYTLPLVESPNRWLLQHAMASYHQLYDISEQAATFRLNRALCYLEKGENQKAAEVFTELINESPETRLRPLVRFYLFQLTGELIDARPPSDRIPITPDLFAPEPEEGDKGNKDDPAQTKNEKTSAADNGEDNGGKDAGSQKKEKETE